MWRQMHNSALTPTHTRTRTRLELSVSRWLKVTCLWSLQVLRLHYASRITRNLITLYLTRVGIQRTVPCAYFTFFMYTRIQLNEVN